MKSFLSQNNRGFIALISIIIISSVLLVATLSIAQFGIANRYFIMNLEQKTASYKLAEACIEIARIKIYNDSNYTQTIPQSMNIDNDLCTLELVTKNGTQTTVRVSGQSSKAVTHLQIIFNNLTADHLSWIELAHF